jgi:hypothetical protein
MEFDQYLVTYVLQTFNRHFKLQGTRQELYWFSCVYTYFSLRALLNPMYYIQ